MIRYVASWKTTLWITGRLPLYTTFVVTAATSDFEVTVHFDRVIVIHGTILVLSTSRTFLSYFRRVFFCSSDLFHLFIDQLPLESSNQYGQQNERLCQQNGSNQRSEHRREARRRRRFGRLRFSQFNVHG